MIKNTIYIIKLALFSSFMAISSQGLASDQDYNAGFLAAESGDYQQAVSKWGPLASAGHAMAQFNIALMYHGGLGVEASEAEAVKWYKLAAENGYMPAQEFLSAAYQEGWFGLPQDKKQAQYWQQMADLR